MPAMIMTITRDAADGVDTFIVRVYEKVEDIGREKPVDMWELEAIIPDEETMDYLIDKMAEEAMG